MIFPTQKLLTAVTLLGYFLESAQSAVIPHTSVAGFPEQLSSYVATFKPSLKVFTGCVPFPAVDANGNIGGGLKPTGAQDGQCSRSTGQVYVRHTVFRGECALMYSWYFPKDEVTSGIGHRHDWESIVVWLSACTTNARINAVSYSAHGKYKSNRAPPLKGTHPMVAYQEDPFPLDHSLTGTNYSGGTQPGVTWLQLTPAARQALNTYNFGNANCPFNDGNFEANLGKAWYR